MEYADEVRQRFASPLHVGDLQAAPDVISGSAGSIEQGVMFRLYARVDRGQIREVKYRVYGCPHSIAAASLAAERLRGATLEQLEAWDWRGIASTLDIPAQKRGRLLVLEDAVRLLARAWRALRQALP